MSGEAMDIISMIVHMIEPYDSLDLLAKVGALQLCPENLDHSTRIEAFAYAVNCLPFEKGKPKITRNKLEQLLTTGPVNESCLRSYEDPAVNAFTESLPFFGGSYIVFPGQTVNATYITKHLHAAVFNSKTFKKYKSFQKQIYSLSRGLLLLSDVVAERCGYRRNMKPIMSENIKVPYEINQLLERVKFNKTKISEILESVDLSINNLKPFIRQFGELGTDNYELSDSPLFRKPIVEFDNHYIIAEIWMLLAALRHQIIITAKENGLLTLLSSEYLNIVNQNVCFSLDRLDFKRLEYKFKETKRDFELKESLWTFDTDKIAYVTVMIDDCQDYSENNIFEFVGEIKSRNSITDHISKIYEQIHEGKGESISIFHLFIFAGVGREFYFVVDTDKISQEILPLIFPAPELEILSFLYGSERLLLYKFAQARMDIRKKAKIFVTSILDEFEFYRSNNFSYYASDDFFNGLTISPGFEIKTRMDYLDKYDPHQVPFFGTDGYVNVINIYGTSSCPIYAPIHIEKNPNGLFVEIDPIPFWIIFDRRDYNYEESLVPIPQQFVDLIAYWIWQFEEVLGFTFQRIKFKQILVVYVQIDYQNNWVLKEEKSDIDSEKVSVQIKEDDRLLVILKPPIMLDLNSADNSGELLIIQKIFEKLCELLNIEGFTEAASHLSSLIPKNIKKHSSNSMKKKLIIMDASKNPTLKQLSVNFRKVQEHDTSIILDQVGSFLKTEMNIPSGEIPKHNYNEIFKKIVEFLFCQIKMIVVTLNYESLLEFLLKKYEAIIYEKEERRISIPTQLACFGSVEEMINQLKEEISEINEAGIACRFLIEFVVTQPPNGNLKISLATYDRLLAFSSELIVRGSHSDLDFYELFQFKFKILKSGRLGFNRQEYMNKLSSFQYFNAKDKLFEAQIDFENLWKGDPENQNDELPQLVRQMNLAFLDEFGFEFVNISDFILSAAELLDLPEESEMKCVEIPLFVRKMSLLLEWSEEKAHKILNFLKLEQREEFLEPPSPFDMKDVYPWRFNRELSYLRRPFLVLNKGGQSFICWGTRHLYSSLQYLLRSAMTGRLRESYKSKKMRMYIGQVNTEKGKLFNDEVYDKLSELPNIILDKRVKKINGKRIGFPNSDLGDIDVLVLLIKKKKILALECKNLEIARNPYEMSRELEELFSDRGNKKSTIIKHLSRIQWLEDNIDLVLGHYKITGKRKWKVEGALIVQSEMITPHFHESKIPVFTLREFLQNI